MILKTAIGRNAGAALAAIGAYCPGQACVYPGLPPCPERERCALIPLCHDLGHDRAIPPEGISLDCHLRPFGRSQSGIERPQLVTRLDAGLEVLPGAFRRHTSHDFESIRVLPRR